MRRRPLAQHPACTSRLLFTLLAAAMALPACSGDVASNPAPPGALEQPALAPPVTASPVGQPLPGSVDPVGTPGTPAAPEISGLPGAEQPPVAPPIGEAQPSPQNPTPAATEPLELRLFRLTRGQYGNTVKALTGVDPQLEDLPPDLTPGGFSNLGTSVSKTGNTEVSQFDGVAFGVARQLFSDQARAEAFVGCAPASADAACVQSFLENKLPEAFRRPVTADEVARYQSVVDTVAADQQSVVIGLQYATATMMQSPNFVYRVEQTVPDAASPTGTRYDGHTMASRLSYLLADSPPDSELRAAAAADMLATSDQLVAQAQRLLQAPTARPALTRYFADWFELSNMGDVSKDAELFPEFTAELGADMRMELELLFNEFAFNPAQDFSELFTTRRTYLNDSLAALYEVDPALPREPAAGAEGFFSTTFPEGDPRAGVLTRAAIMSLHARATDTSATLRGVMVRNQVLCQEIPSAPGDVDTELPVSNVPQTQRDQLREHSENPVCATCHAFIDPLGFALESFDPIGRYRETVEGGLVIDTTGELDGVPFADAAEMGRVLRDDPKNTQCIVRKFTEHALSRDPSLGTLHTISNEFEQQGKSFQSLLMGVIKSTAFRFPVQ